MTKIGKWQTCFGGGTSVLGIVALSLAQGCSPISRHQIVKHLEVNDSVSLVITGIEKDGDPNVVLGRVYGTLEIRHYPSTATHINLQCIEMLAWSVASVAVSIDGFADILSTYRLRNAPQFIKLAWEFRNVSADEPSIGEAYVKPGCQLWTTGEPPIDWGVHPARAQ